MSNQTAWRWADPNGQQRLVHEDELRAAIASGVIPPNAPVWTRGMLSWKPASEVAELSDSPPREGSIPPPPAFVVAAQDAFEGKPPPVPAGPAEPPPPPKYVPLPTRTQPQVPIAPVSDTTVDRKPVFPPTPKPKPVATTQPIKIATPTEPVVKPVTKPPHVPNRTPPPLPAVRVVNPNTQTLKSPINATAAATPKRNSTPPPLPVAPKLAPAPAASHKPTQRPPMGVAPPASESLSPASGGRHTVHMGVAPPPLPKLDPLPMAAPTPLSVALPPEPLSKEPSSKFPTLMMFDGDPQAPPLPINDASVPPIVVPPPEPSGITNVVTRPPPPAWGEGTGDPRIPKSPRVPGVVPATRDQPSEAPRPMELSSSDLSSEAHIEVVKAAPLVAAERPATMMGLGPNQLAQNRAAIERSAPTAPLSASDVAATNKLPSHTSSSPPPRPEPSGANIHNLQSLTPSPMASFTTKARDAYASLKERTKDKPPWFLPAIGGASAFVVLILLVAIVKMAIGGSSSDTNPSASTSRGSGSSTASTSSTGANTAGTSHPTSPARAMTCSTSGESHTIAPKALIAGGIELANVGSQLALGYAIAPKEAVFETLDANTIATSGSVHLHSADPVRRVLALDATKAALDGDHKGDKLQGRRTLRASPPIDVGAADGNLAWAAHGTDKAISLWPLASPDAPIEALRGEPLANGNGFAIAFRHSGGIYFGAIAGSPPAPMAGLMHIAGLGTQIGSPAIAVSGDRVMIAWADRATKADPWSLRWTSFKPGDDQAKPKAFTLPPGGLGEQAMSPAIASLGASRFLFVWTEGAVSVHQVRGVVFGEAGPIGDAFTVSAEGVNAGQGQAAVLADGHGVVAFLASTPSKTFEVAATPIQCVEK